jgi:hypothetical protein
LAPSDVVLTVLLGSVLLGFVPFDSPARGQPIPRRSPPSRSTSGAAACGAWDKYCRFAGGGGFVSDEGALLLYGAVHSRGDGLFRISEFWGPGSPAAAWWVELGERTDFEGHRLAIFGEGESGIAHCKERFAQGNAFDDTVLVDRFRLPAGVRYRPFENPGCPANPPAKQFVDLVDTGDVVEVARLDQFNPAFGRKVRSSAVEA